MDIIPEGHDERSVSGASFASLELIHSQEEDDDIARGEDATPRRSNNLEYAYHLDRTGHVNDQQQDTDYSCDEDDGYPTDEGGSFTQPKEKKLRRLHILELARSRLAMKKTNDTPEGSDMTADSSFLANADAIDVENRPDDSTFLADADVEDVTVAKSSRQCNADDIEADSYYDVHASALSRASASKASTIGDQIYKESMLAARMANKEAKNTLADAQSASTYSYRRAYGDNVTLGSTLNSTCSALTDDYCFDARKTGMSDAILPRKVPDERPCDDDNDIRRSYSGPADVDTGTMMHDPSGDNTVEESLARPPPHSLPYMSSDMMECDGEYPEHTARIVTFGDERFVSFGDGEGYVDEGAMQKDRNSGCCGWFISSSRVIKFVVICASLLLLVSIASLTIAYLLPTDEGTSDKESSSVSSEFSIFDTSGNSDVEGNVEGNDDDGDGDGDGDAPGQSGWVAYSPSEDESLDSTPTNFPTELATRAPAKAPSQAPETSFVFTTSSITKSPSNQPSKRPTSKPASPPPSKQPTVKPTHYSTRKPTNVPTPSPSKRPTGQPTTLIPTEMPIIDMAPTVPSPSLSSSVTPLLTKTVTLQASKDTYVTRTSPDQNWGYYGRLRVDDSPRAWSFIRFEIASAFNTDQNEPRKLQSMKVVEAKLRLYTLDEGGGGMIYALPNARRWRESKLTWNNMDQALDRTGQFEVGSIDWVKAFQWYEIDVTDAFQGGIVQTFLIKSSTTNGVAFSSRDRGSSGKLGPQLKLSLKVNSGTILGKSMPVSEAPTRQPTTSSPPKQPSNPAAPIFVPPGCPSTSDFDFAFKGAFISKQDMPADLQVVYPSQDSCVSGGPSTSIKLLEFDLGPIAPSSSVSLRLYANIVDDINTISLHSLPDFVELNEDEVARDDFGIPPISKAGPSFQVTPSDTGRWMDVDVTDLVDGNPSADEKFVLVMDSVSAGDSGGGCIFASRDTCHSPKLVAMTESN